MARTRIILADDHRMFAEGLKRSLEPEYDVVLIVDNGQQLVAAVAKHRPDIVITDISMPQINGIEATRQIRERCSGVQVILLTMHEDPVYAATALDEGVAGFVLKNAPLSELTRAIREALEGNVYVSPTIARMVFQLRRRQADAPVMISGRFTPQQREILRLLADGQTVKQVAAAMGVSGKAIEYHKYRMMRQLNVKTTVDLVRHAARLGIVPS